MELACERGCKTEGRKRGECRPLFGMDAKNSGLLVHFQSLFTLYPSLLLL